MSPRALIASNRHCSRPFHPFPPRRSRVPTAPGGMLVELDGVWARQMEAPALRGHSSMDMEASESRDRWVCCEKQMEGASWLCACWSCLEQPAAPHLRHPKAACGSTPELGIRRRPLRLPAATCCAGQHELAQYPRRCCLPALQLPSRPPEASWSTRDHVMLHGRHFCRLSALARVPVICK